MIQSFLVLAVILVARSQTTTARGEEFQAVLSAGSDVRR
jgi:hypothetical protein